MLESDAKKNIFGVLKDINGCETDDITPDTHLVEEGYLDSLDSMKFVFEIENKLGIKFAEKDLFDEQFFKVSFLASCIVNSKKS